MSDATSSGLVELLTKDLYHGTKALSKRIRNEIHLQLAQAFEPYRAKMQATLGRCKTILYRYSPVDFYSFYIPLDVEPDTGDRLCDISLQSLAEHGKHILLSGTGGSGKSMLLRHLYLLQSEDFYVVPLFVELRQFNESADGFFDFVARTVGNFGLRVTGDEVELGLYRGVFVLLLDGLDEVVEDKRHEVLAAIRLVEQSFPKGNSSAVCSVCIG